MTPPDGSRLLGLAEVAAWLRISDKQLRGHIRDGTLAFVNVGRGTRPCYRFWPEDVRAFALSRTTTCAKPMVAPCDVRTKGRRSVGHFEIIDFAALRAAKTRTRKGVTVRPRQKSK